jgi:hypothetical protein
VDDPVAAEDGLAEEVALRISAVPAVECFPGLHGRWLDGHLVEGEDTCIVQELIDLDVVLALFARDGTSDVVKGDLGCTEVGVVGILFLIEYSIVA